MRVLDGLLPPSLFRADDPAAPRDGAATPRSNLLAAVDEGAALASAGSRTTATALTAADARTRAQFDPIAQQRRLQAERGLRSGKLDYGTLFGKESIERQMAELQSTLGRDFDMTFLPVDVRDARTTSRAAAELAHAGVNGGGAGAAAAAFDFEKNPMLAGRNMSPAVALNAVGQDPATGEAKKFAIVGFNGANNKVLDGVFGDTRRVFGAAGEREGIERATLLHESAHAIVYNAEDAGRVAWKKSLGALNSPEGQAGDAIRAWAAGSEGAIAHPEVRQVLLREADTLDRLQAGDRAGVRGQTYDADHVGADIQAIRSRPDYRNFQENMADGFMAMKLKQEGHDLAGQVAAARHKGDAEHDSSLGLRAIERVPASAVQGLDNRQLMTETARLVQGALGL